MAYINPHKPMVKMALNKKPITEPPINPLRFQPALHGELWMLKLLYALI